MVFMDKVKRPHLHQLRVWRRFQTHGRSFDHHQTMPNHQVPCSESLWSVVLAAFSPTSGSYWYGNTSSTWFSCTLSITMIQSNKFLQKIREISISPIQKYAVVLRLPGHLRHWGHVTQKIIFLKDEPRWRTILKLRMKWHANNSETKTFGEILVSYLW